MTRPVNRLLEELWHAISTMWFRRLMPITTTQTKFPHCGLYMKRLWLIFFPMHISILGICCKTFVRINDSVKLNVIL